MSMLRIFDVSGSAVSAHSQRLNTVASNLANAESVAGPDGQSYKSRQVVFSARQPDRADGTAGVRVTGIVEDNAPAKRVYDPKHPLADNEGFVTQSNVNVVEEMVNMISASRALSSSSTFAA